MARDRDNNSTTTEAVISIIGPGMTVVGNCTTEGTLRVEGRVEGSIQAGKAAMGPVRLAVKIKKSPWIESISAKNPPDDTFKA